jgi:cell division protein FtsZ
MNIASGTDEVSMDEIGIITDYIQDKAGLTADIIWGNCHDENLGDKISVTIIATGFKSKAELGKEERSKKTVRVLDTNKPANTLVADAPAFTEDRKVEAPVTIAAKKIELPEVKEEENSLVVEFEIPESAMFATPEAELETEAELQAEPVAEAAPEKKFHTIENNNTEEEQMKDEHFRKSRERIAKLKAMNYRLGQNAMNDYEKEPAFKRKNVTLDETPHSSESRNSNLSMPADGSVRPDINKQNDSLHDLPD